MENIEEVKVKEKLDLGPVWKHLAFVGIGWLGLSLIASIVAVIGESIVGKDITQGQQIGLNVAINLISYILVAIIMLVISLKDVFSKIIEQFKEKHALIDGIVYGFLLLGAGAAISVVTTWLFGETDVNSNQSAIEKMTENYPISLVIMTVILAPIVEEFTYRLGVFNLLRRKNRWVAYGVSALIFGFIHFDFSVDTAAALKTELINIPSYIISGLILCRAYEKHQNIATSIIAHAINNGIAILSLLLLS